MNLRTVKCVQSPCVTLLFISHVLNASMAQFHSPARHYKTQGSAISGQQLPLSSGTVLQSRLCRISFNRSFNILS